jgi:hypothetical protein
MNMPVPAVRRIVAASAMVSLVAWAPTAFAQTERYSDWGSVQELEAGWAVDTMSVRHSAPMVNPGGCRVTNAGYATNPADTGHSLFHTLLLSAFLNRKEVAILVSGCAFDKPRIIGVKIH